MGYRLDFEEMKIVATGGIYVRTFPAAEQIIIDSKTAAKPGIFSNAVFAQSLLPKEHTVLVKKNGHYDYFKTLSVQEKTVTKLENITLFKKEIAFSSLAEEIEYFSISPNGQNIITVSKGAYNKTLNYFKLTNGSESEKTPIPSGEEILEIKWANDSSAALIKAQASDSIFYYSFNPSANGQSQTPAISRLPFLDKNSRQISFNPQDNSEIFYEENSLLYSLKNNRPKLTITGLITYAFSGNNILWVSSTGILQESDSSGVLIRTLSQKKLSVTADKKYKLTSASGKIFLQENASLLLFNSASEDFENIIVPVGSYKVSGSPDNKNFIFWNENKIYSYFPQEVGGLLGGVHELFLAEKITNCQWLNNNYIILASGNEIVISETDYRSNINRVVISSPLSLTDNKTLNINSPETHYVLQSGKLYILTNGTLAVSEKLIP